MEIREQLRILRTARGMTQREIAHALGCTQAYISRLETTTEQGDLLPLARLRRLAEVLNVPPNALLEPAACEAMRQSIALAQAARVMVSA